jgi:hypothetical protein
MLVRLGTAFQHQIRPGLIYALGATIAVTREQRGLRAGLGHEFFNETQDCYQAAPRGRRFLSEELVTGALAAAAVFWSG